MKSLFDQKMEPYQEKLIQQVYESLDINAVPFTLTHITELLLSVNSLLTLKATDRSLVVVLGGRDSGKSQLIQALIDNRVTLDERHSRATGSHNKEN